MKTSTFVTTALTVFITGTLTGCGGGKGGARAEMQKAEALCNAGKPDEARESLFKAAESNKTLQEAVKFAVAGYGDVPHINPCGPVMAELKKQLK
jgi:hypothetical protein